MNRHKLALPIIVSFSIVGQIQPVSPQQAPPPYGGPPPQQAPPPYGGPPPIYANPSRSVGAAPGAQGAPRRSHDRALSRHFRLVVPLAVR